VHVAAPQVSAPQSIVHRATATVSATTAAEPRVLAINSPSELDECLRDHSGQLVVLMCKARSCRPCKMFSKKYERLASTFPGVVFLEVFGDDTTELREMMMKMQIKSTPTFRMYRGGIQVASTTGANEQVLSDTVATNLLSAKPEQALAAK
jgi:thiol-disulfide isomerase/thioredoxin